MEAISALKMVEVVVKDVLLAAITAATNANETLNDATLTEAIATAQAVYDDATVSQEDVNNAAATLNTAVMLAMSAAGDATFLITNPGFESCTETTSNVAASGSAAPLDISGEWTQASSAAWCSSAVVTYGGSGKVNGASAPATDNAGNTGKTLGVSVGWGGTVTYRSAALTLPAGAYTLTIHANNQLSGVTQFTSKNGFIATNGTEYLSTKTSFTYNTWTEDVISFTLNEATEGYIQVGGQAISGGSGSNAKVFFDNITLGYTSFLAAAKSAWDDAVAAAEAARDDATYSNVDGQTRADLLTELAKSEPTTVADYETATDALTAATTAFTTAKADWDGLVTEIAKAQALGVDATDVQEAQNVLAASTTTAAQALAATHDLMEAEYTFVTTDYPYAVELGTWNTEGPTGSLSSQHYKGDGYTYLEQSSSAWSQSSWTIKYDQDLSLPAGNYIFKVAGRKAAGDGVTLSLTVTNGETVLGTVNDFPEGDTGYGIDTDGATNFDPSATYANNNNGRGWQWRYVKFTLSEDATVNISVDAVATTNYQWVSFCDATVQTDNEAGFALIDYNVALANAQAAQSNNDYANVGGAEKAALDAAIDADGTLDKTDKDAIETATQTLKDATTAFTAAKDSYDAYAAVATTTVPELEYADATKKTALTTALATTPADATEAASLASAIPTALRAYYESHALAESVSGAVNMTSVIVNANNPTDNTGWTIDGNMNNPASNESWTDADGTNNHSYFDGGNWSASAWTTKMEQEIELPAGLYLLTAKGRAAENVTFTMSVGEDVVNLPHQNATGNVFDRGWGDASLEFETVGRPVTITVTASTETQHEWFSVSDFRLMQLEEHETPVEVLKEQLLAKIEEANDENTTVNVGDGIFQIPTTAAETFTSAVSTAQSVYDDDAATASEVEQATSDLADAITAYESTELNAPDAMKKYYIKVATAGHAKEGNAVVASLGTTGANNPTGYSFSASAEPTDYLAQAWTFTKVSGNTYRISITMPNGEVYLTNGISNGSAAGWNKSQIQGATASDNAVAFTIVASATDGAFNIVNPATESTIACQTNGPLYTETGNADFTLQEAAKASVAMTVGSGKYASRIFPFIPETTTGLTYYSCEVMDENGVDLVLVEQTEPQANTPYIIEATADVAETFEGYGMASKGEYEVGLLTGVFVAKEGVASDSEKNIYVLQTQNGVQAFHKVETAMKIPAYRLYLTLSASSEVKSLGFRKAEESTGISALEVLTSGNARIYNTSGVRQNNLQKGLNIIQTEDGTTRKVFVK
mgnify:CR=1 FL=1